MHKALALVLFVVLATANSAGYRYGASDLAFYGPAVMRQLDPALFPLDTPVIDAQARLTFMDETVAAVARLTTTSLPKLFLGLYVLTLLLLAAGTYSFGSSLYRSQWTVAALLAVLTLRHAVAKSGTNTLEGYFHPRQLAFAFGACAVAAFLRGRLFIAALALAAAGSLHPTTTLWFAVWLGVAAVVAEPRWRPAGIAAGAALGLAGLWSLTAGPLAGRLALMDPEWLAALGEKDYLFPQRWPASAWLLNLAYVPVILLVFRRRRARGLTSARELGLVAGCLALVAVFAVAVVLNVSRLALAIQLQPARIFWMLDFMAAAYVVWALAESGAVPRPRRPAMVACVLAAVAAARGTYVMTVEFPDRPLFELSVRGDWGAVARWAQAAPLSGGWLADPFHAARYGTSLRMAAGRDVFVEGTKDAAIGMYDRRIALRTRERLARAAGFAEMPVDEMRRLGAEHGLTYVVTERSLPLPAAFQSGTLRVYELR